MNAPLPESSWQLDADLNGSLSAFNGAAKPIQMRSLPAESSRLITGSIESQSYQHETAYSMLWRESLLAGISSDNQGSQYSKTRFEIAVRNKYERHGCMRFRKQN